MHRTRAGIGCLRIPFFALILFFARILLFAAGAHAQSGSISETLLISGSTAYTWTRDRASIIQIDGPVAIKMDRVSLSASQAVLWLSPDSNGLLGEQDVDIALIGEAHLSSPDNHLSRSGPQLLISTIVRGQISISADQRLTQDLSDSDLFRAALNLRAGAGQPTTAPSTRSSEMTANVPQSSPPQPMPGTALAAQPRTSNPDAGLVRVNAHLVHQLVLADDTVAWELTDGVTLFQARPNGDLLELQAENVVVFTRQKNKEAKAAGQPAEIGKDIISAYLEGDVRIDLTPAQAPKPEQRLSADSAYYEFATDRAVMTQAVLHTVDPKYQVPVVIRAKEARQLAQGELTAQGVRLSTSNFAVPDFSLYSQYAYIRQDVRRDDLIDYDFVSRNNFPELYGLPLFYFPYLAGQVNNGPFPLREVGFGNNTQLGYFASTRWGLFETLGRPKPSGLDVAFGVNDYSKRGLGGSLDGNYSGGFVTNSADPWNFFGDFASSIQADKGIDVLGGARVNVKPTTDLRGMALWEHQHLFPDDWQVQFRAGWESDVNYREYYTQNQFDDGLPLDASFYAKRQKDTEAITFLAESDTTPFTTNADRQQEQFDVQRLPEIGYDRVGDSLADDHLTFFSENLGSDLRAQPSHATLAQQGYLPGLSPGLPSDGFTGTTNAQVLRGDSRQEIDWPMAIGQIRFVPYAFGRVTAYSDNPNSTGETRLFSGAGVRMATSFWKIDDSIESELLDLHRMRHIVQPELNLFTSGTTVDRSRVFVYDSNIDGINDVSAVQLALHQHWETMRGGPGSWHSEDVFDLNIEGNFFANRPPPDILNPIQFRGLYFPSAPETSVPRQGINGDADWHVSDTTALFASAEWNYDVRELALAQAGLAVSRSDRLTYYVDDAYLQVLNSNVLSFTVEYKLSPKYLIQFNQSIYSGNTHDISTTVMVVRQFNTFAISADVSHDAIAHTDTFHVNLIPTALGSVAQLGVIKGLVGLTPQ